MKINKKSLTPIDFEGLKIFDYTAEKEISLSLAEIIVPPKGKHKKTFSKKFDNQLLQENFLIVKNSCFLKDFQ